MYLLLQALVEHTVQGDSTSTPLFLQFLQDEWNEVHASERNVVFGPLQEDQRRTLILRDSTIGSDNTSSHDETSQRPKTKDVVDPPSPKRTRSKSIVVPEDIYPLHEIKQIRNELEQIRIHRSEEGGAGCTCRKLHVPLISAHGTSSHPIGKKSHHRRFTERSVKDELRKRGISIHTTDNFTALTREELEQLLPRLL